MEDEYTEVSNESAIALVRKVRTRNGVRLEIHSPEQDRRVYLDPLLLESLAWQTPETFADTLEDPPEATNTKEVEGAQVETENEYTEFANEFPGGIDGLCAAVTYLYHLTWSVRPLTRGEEIV